MTRHQHHFIDGPDGQIEVFVDPHEAPVGLALIGHPHPLFGGTADNKVVTTLARAFRELNCIAVRPSFRGVGGSEGEHTHGDKETEDLLAVLAWARQHYGHELPVYLAGFSFGAYVVTRVAKRLAEAGEPARRLVLVGTAAGYVEGARSYETEAVADDTIVIHGDRDETVRLENVLAWADPLELPVVVVPGADHFFHRKLHLIRAIIARAWK
jgi:alpha/beta superfamily hydrolase